ncbi:hypothetical protein CASFOL_006065 [Castilleja foliolosa]|uniref:Uncharacterized protein n=1 Tax=Castilleja foliolosa TaxID=1961234 RepID=A0ABD3E5V0_9LAMI
MGFLFCLNKSPCHHVENIIINQEKKAGESAPAVEIERSMDYRTKNLQETGAGKYGSRDRYEKAEDRSSSSEHKAIESGEKIKSSMGYTGDSSSVSSNDKIMALIQKATESGAYDYSCFPPSWLGDSQSPMLGCEGSENYDAVLKMASSALDRIKDDPDNVGKTFKFVCMDKVCIIFFEHYLMQFFVREVVSNADATADAPLKTLQVWLYYPNSVLAEVIKWRWFQPSEGV